MLGAGPQLLELALLHADCSIPGILGLALRATICLVPCTMHDVYGGLSLVLVLEVVARVHKPTKKYSCF